MIETAPDDEGRYWTYATLNDAFTIRRRCGSATRSTASARRAAASVARPNFTMWNTDVLNEHATAEFGPASTRPTRVPT